jgi:hypothetical protein
LAVTAHDARVRVCVCARGVGCVGARGIAACQCCYHTCVSGLLPHLCFISLLIHLCVSAVTTPVCQCCYHTCVSVFLPHLCVIVLTTPVCQCCYHTCVSVFLPHLCVSVLTTPELDAHGLVIEECAVPSAAVHCCRNSCEWASRRVKRSEAKRIHVRE